MEQNIEPKIEPKIESPIEPKVEPEKKASKNTLIFVIIGVVILLILFGVWYFISQKSAAPLVVPQAVAPTTSTAPSPTSSAVTTPPAPKEDSISSINQELNSLELGDLNKEFQTIDSDLNSL